MFWGSPFWRKNPNRPPTFLEYCWLQGPAPGHGIPISAGLFSSCWDGAFLPETKTVIKPHEKTQIQQFCVVWRLPADWCSYIKEWMQVWIKVASIHCIKSYWVHANFCSRLSFHGWPTCLHSSRCRCHFITTENEWNYCGEEQAYLGWLRGFISKPHCWLIVGPKFHQNHIQ